MRRNRLLILVAVCAAALSAQTSQEPSAPAVKAALEMDNGVRTQPEAAARCTLTIKTVPDGATVLFNNVNEGVSPVTITGVDSGKHTIVLQKAGYYQKKAVVTITEMKPVTLEFELSAPGRLTITTVPDSAELFLDGVHAGISPFTDSLVKPGTHALRIVKDRYVTVDDSISIGSAAAVQRIDTLVHPASYNDSIAYAAEVASLKKKRLSLGLIGGTFGLFILVILAMEGRDQ